MGILSTEIILISMKMTSQNQQQPDIRVSVISNEALNRHV